MEQFRYKLVIEYDGTPFVGWQRQANGVSVQSVVEGAIARLLKQPVILFAAGRTDVGVHATHQVAHFDSPTQLDLHKFIPSGNFFLRPHPVCIVDAYAVPESFHARFCATSRSYVYKILNRKYPSVLLEKKAWHIHKPLDVPLMHNAAQVLVGKHDFSSFRSTHCQAKSAVRTINSISVSRIDDVVEVHITAPSFLHNQVRIIVGALHKIGIGAWDSAYLEQLLIICDRTASAPTAPAHGLYLCGVSY